MKLWPVQQSESSHYKISYIWLPLINIPKTIQFNEIKGQYKVFESLRFFRIYIKYVNICKETAKFWTFFLPLYSLAWTLYFIPSIIYQFLFGHIKIVRFWKKQIQARLVVEPNLSKRVGLKPRDIFQNLFWSCEICPDFSESRKRCSIYSGVLSIEVHQNFALAGLQYSKVREDFSESGFLFWERTTIFLSVANVLRVLWRKRDMTRSPLVGSHTWIPGKSPSYQIILSSATDFMSPSCFWGVSPIFLIRERISQWRNFSDRGFLIPIWFSKSI